MMIARLKTFALPLSLALNVFFVVAGAIHAWHRPPFPHHGPHGMVEEIARALAPADAAIFRNAFSSDILSRPPPRPYDKEALIIRALLAQPFDPAALEAALRAHDQDRQMFERAMVGALVGAAGAMSAEGRRQLVEWHMTHRPPPPPDEGGPGPDHEPPPPPR